MRTPTLPGRRRAAEFDDALSGRRESRDWVVRDLVRTVDTLRARPPVTPDPQFTADLRVRVLAAAERDLARLPEQGRTRPPVTGPVSMPLRRRVGLAAAASMFVLVGGGAGLASASTQAIPGDLLYPVKRGVEQTQVALDRSDGARGRTLVGQADTRLAELRELTADGQQPGNDALVVDTLHTFTDQAEEGGDALLAAHASGDTGAVRTLDEFTVGAGKALTDMSGTLPAEAQDSYTAAAGTVASLQAQISEVCSDCSSATAVRIPVRAAGVGQHAAPDRRADRRRLPAGRCAAGRGVPRRPLRFASRRRSRRPATGCRRRPGHRPRRRPPSATLATTPATRTAPAATAPAVPAAPATTALATPATPATTARAGWARPVTPWTAWSAGCSAAVTAAPATGRSVPSVTVSTASSTTSRSTIPSTACSVGGDGDDGGGLLGGLGGGRAAAAPAAGLRRRLRRLGRSSAAAGGGGGGGGLLGGLL